MFVARNLTFDQMCESKLTFPTAASLAALQSSPVPGKNMVGMACKNSDDSDGSRRNLHDW